MFYKLYVRFSKREQIKILNQYFAPRGSMVDIVDPWDNHEPFDLIVKKNVKL